MASSVISRTLGLIGEFGIKAPVRVASTASLTLAGEQTIDGVAVSQHAGTSQPPDRVLVKDQSDQTTNGIYAVQQGAWLRSADFDGPGDVANGTLVLVAEGSVNGGALFQVTTADPIQIDGNGASDITFAEYSPPSTPLDVTDGSASVSATTLRIGANLALTDNGGGEAQIDGTGGGGGSGGAAIPQGRLTLQSGKPVMTADQAAKTVIYYDSYQGNAVPVWDGSAMQSLTIGSDEISVTLDAVNQPSGFLYDVFAYSDSGVLKLGIAGQGWVAGNLARHTGAGSSELQLKAGVWTNKNGSLPLLDNGITVATVAANKATYLGTFYATSNGHTAWIANPAAADAGTANILGLYNAYNRVVCMAREQDSRTSWTYSTGTWRPSDNSTNNRITFVDGLAQSFIDGFIEQAAGVDAGSTQAQVGLNLDSISATPAVFGITNSTAPVMFTVRQTFAPVLGLHYVQSMENCDTPGTATFYANGAVQMVIASLEM